MAEPAALPSPPPSPASGRSRLPQSIAGVLFSAMALMVIATAAVSYLVSVNGVAEILETEEQLHAARTASEIEQALIIELRHLHAAAAALAAQPLAAEELRRGVADAELSSRLVRDRSRSGVDVLELRDARGQSVAFSGAMTDQRAASHAQREGASFETRSDGNWLMVTVPVLSPGEVLGQATAGRRLSATYLRGLMGAGDLHVSLLVDDRVFASTLPEQAVAVQLTQLDRRTSVSESRFYEIDGFADLFVRPARIGERPLQILVHVPEASRTAIVERLRVMSLAGAALILALSLVAAAYVSRRLSMPLRELSARAHALSQRFAGSQVEPRQGEIESLVASVEAMTSALLNHSERLKQAHAKELQHGATLQRQYAMMRLLRDVAAASAASADIDAALRKVLHEIGRFFDWPLGRVALLDEDEALPRGQRSMWTMREGERFASFVEVSNRARITPTVRNLIGRAFLTGAPYWLGDIDRLAGWNRLQAARDCGLRSAFAIPVMASGHAVAFIEFFCDRPVESSPELEEMLATIADELSHLAERHLAQKTLAASQRLVRRLALVAERSDKLFLLLDVRGRVAWVNDSVLRRRGVALGRLLGAGVYEALGLAPDDAQAVMTLGDAVVRGVPCRTDFLARGENGAPIVLEVEGLPLADDGGVYGQYMLMCTDVTEARARQKALIDARDAAEQANRAKSQFLANMSHEIRTPMNGVLGMTELLLGTALSAKQRRFVEAVYRSGETLLEIINDILDLSKIEAGRLELDRREFCPRALVEDVFEMLAPRANEKRLELACRIESAVPPVLIGDPLRLRQVFANLVGNAIKFTEAGEVVVTISGEPPAADSTLYRLAFEVRDTGVGIAPAALSRLFTPFMQADQSMSRRYGGTGLGLTISRQLVEMMGGRIDVQSTPGKGSVFRFDVRLPAGETTEAATPLPAGQLSGKHALLVEDNPLNRSVLEGHLSGFGMRVASALHGAQGLELLRGAAAAGTQFDVVVVDLKMPVMDGATMIERLRADPALRHLPVLMLTSIDDTAEVGRAHSAGVQVQLAKPVRRSDLAHALMLVLGQGSPRVSPAPDENRLRGVRVLLAEDNPVNQEVVRAMLAGYGCALQVATDGEQALRLLRSSPFDLVLMDCQMPRLDGFDAVRRLRTGGNQDGATAANVPVIALTANALAGDAERCAAAGFSDYLAKPVRHGRLVQTMLRWLRQSNSAADAAMPGAVDVASPAPVAVAPCPAAADEPVLDMAAIERIRDMQRRGAVDLLPRLRRVFIDSAARQVASIDAALAAGDGEALRRAAHTLKSASGNLGAVRLSRCCARLEALGKNGQLAEAGALWQAGRADYAQAVAALGELDACGLAA